MLRRKITKHYVFEKFRNITRRQITKHYVFGKIFKILRRKPTECCDVKLRNITFSESFEILRDVKLRNITRKTTKHSVFVNFRRSCKFAKYYAGVNLRNITPD